MPKRRTWVLKIGGSLARSPELAGWLQAIAGANGEPGLVVVPGGGPYADEVRRAQEHWRFDDSSAHRLAVLAMEQYAALLQVLEPALHPAAGIDELRALAATGRAALWLPARAALAAPDMPQSWDVTSDSLSLWLAQRLDAECLILVKACAPPDRECDATALARAGFVDRYFPVLLAQTAGGVCWFAKHEYERFAETMRQARAGAATGAGLARERRLIVHDGLSVT